MDTAFLSFNLSRPQRMTELNNPAYAKSRSLPENSRSCSGPECDQGVDDHVVKLRWGHLESESDDESDFAGRAFRSF